MSNSPQIEVFAIFDSTTGDRVTGSAGTCSFDVYKDDQGADVTPQPTIVEIGGGLYYFVPTFPTSTARGVTYMLTTGAGHAPRYYWRYVRREDWFPDDNGLLRKMLTNRWKIFTSGADNNKLVIYDDDGTTVLKKFQLKDSSGLATTINPFERIPE